MDHSFILAETEKLLLIHVYEDAYLIDKVTNTKKYLGNFYGDPNCGLISSNNSFCFVGGYEKCLLYKERKIVSIADYRLTPTFAARQITDFTLLILTDPWSANSAIWQLNIESLLISKIRDFSDYRDKPYTEDIIW